MNDIVFMDTETLGLDINAPIWEFAAIKRVFDDDGSWAEEELHFFVQHADAEEWIPSLREDFVADYRARYDETTAFCWSAAARSIASFVGGATVVGAVPDFDTTRIRHQLLGPLGIEDPWHYHLIDVENLAVGYLRGLAVPGFAPPWNSDEVSSALGVTVPEDERHTAMGDARWAMRLYDAVMGGAA